MIKTTLGIDGMMCSMCETHVNDVVRRNFDVESARSNRRKGACVVVSEQPLDRERVAAALDDLGYRLTSLREEPYAKKRFSLFS